MSEVRGTLAPPPLTPLRVPPHNVEAEQALLGSMFLSSEAVEVGIAAVTREDFYRPSHQKIFDAIYHLYSRSVPIDQVSVADRLESVNTLEQIGGKAYLLDITGVVPTAANAARYAEIVRRTSMLRDLIAAANQIVSLGYEAPDDMQEVVEEAERTLFQVTNKRVASKFQGMEELLEVSFKQLEELFERQEHISGVPTGFEDLDKLLAGMHRGDLIILAARPSVGKTALALNIAVNAAKAGAPVALFSLEMAAEQLIQRVLCSEARINSQDVRTGHIKEADWSSIHRAMGQLADLEFYVDDTPSISILEVRAKARRQLRDKPDGLIIVDYLQLMQPQNRRSENRQTEIAEISRGLKILAKELSVPVLALSQLSRAVEQRAGKRPQLSDLRESGAIEQDADVVIFIDRNTDPRAEDQDDDRPQKGMAEIIVAKHRNGPTGMVPLVFNERYTKFVSFTKKI
ncbi:MAG: replicative DNA helicase [Coriobacteriia bacterium]|nr:replicative DNA helicase [Coriobacteriia bacterium]